MKKKTKHSTLSNNLYILKQIHTASPGRILFDLSGIIITSVSNILLDVYLLKYIINGIQEGLDFKRLVGFILIITAFHIFSTAFSHYYWQKFAPVSNQKIYSHIQKALFEKSSSVELACFEDPDFYDKYVKAISEANNRLIDRPMRPLFDEELRNDVVVTCTVLANDYDNPVEIVASLGASISIASSDVPWNGPVATTNVAYVNGEYVVNPSAEERAAASCFVTIASTFEKVVMIETEANESPESIVLECIRIAHETNMEIVKFINGIVAEIGKPKFTFEKAAVNHDLLDELCAYGMDQIEYALDTDDKNIREERLTAARRDFAEKFAEKYEDFDLHIEVCLYKMQKKVVKKWLLAGKRVDGRGMDEIRPLAAEVGVLPRVHGSGLFTRGQTQVLSICTLNTLSAAQKLDTIYPEETKRYIHHYNFPAFSTGEAKAARSTSRREIGHGALAEKALLPVIPSVEEFPYAIRVVSEVLSSNGSTSQGSICGSTLALMDAGVPIKRPVAGISCGLISDQETGEWRTFTDIQGVEDFHGEMDFKVAGTTEGITAIQMDLKNKGLTMEIIADALERTRKARLEILSEIMLPCIAEPRAEVSEYAPKMISMKIPVDKIREVIGSGGKTIQKICTDTGAKIDIDDDGSVFISAVDSAAAYAAKKMVDDICFVPEVGKLYYGKVVRILPIGAFVEIAPGHDGMVHISKLENYRVDKVEDVLKLGDMTWVKFMGFDEKGRANFSRKDALKELAQNK